MNYEGFSNGFIERKRDGSIEGEVSVEGVNLSPIVGQYFKNDGDTYLWLKRKPMLVYDIDKQKYDKKEKKPKWQCYLKKQLENGAVAYKGEFVFLHFRFSISGVWDTVFGTEKNRLNLFVERLPMSEQTIINNITRRKQADNGNGRKNQ